MNKPKLTLIFLLFNLTAFSQINNWEVNLSSGYANMGDHNGYFISTQVQIPISKKVISLAPTFGYATAVSSNKVWHSSNGVTPADENNRFDTSILEDRSTENDRSKYGGETQTSIGLIVNFHFLNGNPNNKFNFSFGVGPSYKTKIENDFKTVDGVSNLSIGGEIVSSTPYTTEWIDFESGSTISLMIRMQFNYELNNNLYTGINVTYDSDSYTGSPFAPLAMFGAHIGYKIQRN